ncbi:hypothetical protein TYRP_003905 [Tyrophagus putrescentiae]|nr:hypothetical protein TYRP_003905 [Tyrophagus putrescentiae]
MLAAEDSANSKCHVGIGCAASAEVEVITLGSEASNSGGSETSSAPSSPEKPPPHFYHHHRRGISQQPQRSSLNNTSLNTSLNNTLNTSLNTSLPCSKEDAPIELKLKRLNQIRSVTIRAGQPLSAAFEQISALWPLLPAANIALYHRDEMVDPRSTPLSLGLTIADILEVMFRSVSTKTGAEDASAATTAVTSSTEAADAEASNSNSNETSDPNFLTLHFRDNSKKKKVTLRANRFQSLRSLLEAFAREREVSPESVIFEFDSEEMALGGLVNDYDLEDDDQIDVLYR